MHPAGMLSCSLFSFQKGLQFKLCLMGMNKFTGDMTYTRDVTNARNEITFSILKEVYIVSKLRYGIKHAGRP